MNKKLYTIALAGNANVGKSVIFNQLTGGNQIIGNWPGKTVEKAEGHIEQEGTKIHVIDLPGIYSLSTYSEEEIVSREFIAKEKPDAVINVVDASSLERNLFFTLQLVELESPLIVALNQYDIMENKGLSIDFEMLSSLLGVPVVPTIAVRNKGLKELFEKSKEVIKNTKKVKPILYGREVEEKINILTSTIEKEIDTFYPPRFIAIKLLENDTSIKTMVKNPDIIALAEKLKKELTKIHGESPETVIISERYTIASRIAEQVTKKKGKTKINIGDSIDKIALNKITGYILLLGLVLLIFYGVFKFGSYFSELLSASFELLKPIFIQLPLPPLVNRLLWNGLMIGIIAGVAIVLPYIAPFYLILALLEDSGYLARIAFLTDNIMHKLGLHGKAFIPLIEGFGCTVPAVLGTRIMERDRDRFIAAILATLVPCSARTVILLGLVAAFLGPVYAIIIYALTFILMYILGRLLNRYIKGSPTGLVMEMPLYKKPVPKIILRQTWVRLKDFVYFAFPIIIAANIVMEVLTELNWIVPIANFFKPVMTNWLGLPPLAGITFLFGILRKELTLIMLSTLYHTANFAEILTPRQIFIFGFVTMIYIPCVATIAVFKREFGWKRATVVAIGEFLGAIVLGGILNQVLRIFMP
jgi:ferrous iron transport protein B